MKRKQLLLLLALLITAAAGAWGKQIYISYPAWPSGTSVNGDGNLVLEVELSDSFENLKAKIEDKSGLNPTYMHLFNNSIECEDVETLAQKGVSGGSVLTLVYDLKAVKLADGTADAGNWTATLGSSTTPQSLPVYASKGDAVTLTYGGRMKVKSVTATTDAEPDPLATPLTIEAITAGTIKVDIRNNEDPTTLSTGMKYSTDGGTTKTFITQTTDITVAQGDKVQFYGNGTQTQVYGGDTEVKIQGSGDGFQTKVYGNIMSLLDEEGFATKTDLPNRNYVFFGLFWYNKTLIDASELLLPAATLTYACYQQMFEGCTSLTTAPKLPATTLATGCYHRMFRGCTSLTSAYVKAAYTEENDKCSDMFNYCTATGAVLHTTSDNKDSWEKKMDPDKDWSNWTVAADWED